MPSIAKAETLLTLLPAVKACYTVPIPALLERSHGHPVQGHSSIFWRPPL